MDGSRAGALRRGRRRDARDNDARILDAALSILATDGWGSLHFSRVSAETQITVSPIRDRFADRSSLAAQVWAERIQDALLPGVEGIIDAVPDPTSLAEDATWLTDRMLEALQPFEEPAETYLAAIELIIMARFDPMIAAAVDDSLGSLLASRLTPSRDLTPGQAARRGFAVSVALGLLFLARGVPWPAVSVVPAVSAMCLAMCEDESPRPLPPERAEHLDAGAVFDTGDPAWDSLLQATLDSVGAFGYEGATLDIIARRSGYSTGVIQNRYASKRDLFLDATRRMLAAAVLLNATYVQVLGESHSPGIADAAEMREFMERDRRLVRSISFERIRLAWHDDEVAEAVRAEVVAAFNELPEFTGTDSPTPSSRMHFSLALGQGCALLADLWPAAAELPFDVITVPLHNADPSTHPSA